MGISSTTIVVPAKIALSRYERFLETACRACRADWSGLALFMQDGLLRDHLTSGIPGEMQAIVRVTPEWNEKLRDLSTEPHHKCRVLANQANFTLMPPLRSCLGASLPAPNNSRAVIYVVRSQGEAFGPGEEVALQALSQLLASENQQDESHLTAKLRVLNQVAQAAANLGDVQRLFGLALAELDRHIPWHCGAVWLRDDDASDDADGICLRLRPARCSDRAVKVGVSFEQAVTVADSILLPCVQEGTATYVDEAGLRAVPCPLANSLVRGGVSASFAVPLRAGERTLGVLQCLCLRPGGFTNEQIQLFYLVADLLGPATAQALWAERLVKANTELRATQAQLIQSEKIRALGQMASGMAHDFNNALCGVLGFLDLALLERTLPPTCRDYLDSSKTCALDAAQTVRRVQEFARLQRTADDQQPIELDELVQQTIDLTRPRWESLSQLSNPITAEVRPAARRLVLGNVSELREALTNLIFNAVDAMPRGGNLTIQTWAEGDSAFLAVQDTGVGISLEDQRRLFEPFFTTKGERGTGMGLSVTFSIIQRHRGEISVDSKISRGTTFTIRLPVTTATAKPAKSEPGLAVTATLSTILIVEDDESVRRFLSSGLQQLGYPHQTAATAEAALDLMAGRQFDVIVTDLGLPGMSGAELAKTVRQQSAATPVVLLTGWGEQIQAENQKLEGVTQVLSKPVTLKTLAKTLVAVRAL